MGRILLIDDDHNFTDFLTGHIRTSYPLLQVELCDNPLAARQAISAGGYDLMLIDLEIPGCNGLELLTFAIESGADKNRIVIISDREADFLHQICPMGSCLAVLNKFEVRQKAVLEMILSSVSRKSAARSGAPA